MTEPVLVVDLGYSTTSAMLVRTAHDVHPLKDVSGNDAWPTAVYRAGGDWLVGDAATAHKLQNPSAYREGFKEHLGSTEPLMLDGEPYLAEQLAAAMLAALAKTAAATYGVSPRRLLITVPHVADEAWRDATLAAGYLAGFRDVELLSEPAAAAHAVPGAAWTKGSRILVYDLGGGTFDVALVCIGDSGPEVLDCSGLPSGSGADQVDLALAADLRTVVDGWLADHPEHADESAYLAATIREHARTLKHRLTGSETAVTRVMMAPYHSTDRARLTEAAEPLLQATVACCLELLQSQKLEPSDLAGVVLAGGGSKMPVVASYVEKHFGVPARPAFDVGLAVVTGAAQWCRGAATRQVRAEGPADGVIPLRWLAPDRDTVSTLARWLVEPDDCFRPGDALARVRLAGGALYDLVAGTSGRVVRRHVEERENLFDGDWVLTSLCPMRPEDLCESEAPMWRIEEAVTAFVISPKGNLIALAVATGPSRTRLQIVRAGDGAVLHATEFVGRVQALAWSPDDRTVAFGVLADKPEIRLLTPGGEPRDFARLTGAVNELVFTPDGGELLAGCGKGFLYRIDMATRNARSIQLMWNVESLAVHPSGSFCVVAGEDSHTGGRLCVVPLNESTPAPEPLRYPAPIGRVRFGRDGSRLMVASDSVLHFVSFSTELASIDVRAGTATGPIRAVHGVFHAVRTPEHTVRVTAGGGASVVVPDQDAEDLAFTPDGRRLLIVDKDSVALWRLTREGIA